MSFPCKIEARNDFRLHRLGIDFLDRHAAGRHDGFTDRPRPGHRKGQGLKSFDQTLALFAGNLIDRTVFGDSGLIE